MSEENHQNQSISSEMIEIDDEQKKNIENIENIKDVSGKDLKYLANALQFVKVYTYTQERAWFDAVRFANGKIYLAGDEVGTYDKNKWYTVE